MKKKKNRSAICLVQTTLSSANKHSTQRPITKLICLIKMWTHILLGHSVYQNHTKDQNNKLWKLNKKMEIKITKVRLREGQSWRIKEKQICRRQQVKKNAQTLKKEVARAPCHTAHNIWSSEDTQWTNNHLTAPTICSIPPVLYQCQFLPVQLTF